MVGKRPFLITYSDFFVAFFLSAVGASQNRGECPVDTLLFHWENDKLPSQEEVMEIFQFNTNLRLDVRYERSEKNFAEENELDRVFKCRRQLPNESSFYETLPKVLDGYASSFIFILSVVFNLFYFRPFPACRTFNILASNVIFVFGLEAERKVGRILLTTSRRRNKKTEVSF